MVAPKTPIINFNPLQHDPVFVGPCFGWQYDPRGVAESMDRIERIQGSYPIASVVAQHLLDAADDNAPVFFWKAEEKLLGKRIGSWNQKSVGSCVGFGCTRSGQDLLFWEIAAGEAEQYPGTELSPEVTYAGSRVEVGKGRVNGDGSLGSWAAEFLKGWGVVARGKYGNIDLEDYSESLCRSLGNSGLPTDLENVAKEHPVTSVALVESGDEAWAMVGAGKPVAVCSNRGFSMRRNKDGTCNPTGQWNHCMEVRGRFVRGGRKYFVIQNSWGDYLTSENNVVEFDGGQEELPEGCFATTIDVVDGMMRQGDSYAYAGLAGWKSVRIDYNPLKR